MRQAWGTDLSRYSFYSLYELSILPQTHLKVHSRPQSSLLAIEKNNWNYFCCCMKIKHFTYFSFCELHFSALCSIWEGVRHHMNIIIYRKLMTSVCLLISPSCPCVPPSDYLCMCSDSAEYCSVSYLIDMVINSDLSILMFDSTTAESLTNHNEAELQRRCRERQQEIDHMQQVLETKIQLLQEVGPLTCSHIDTKIP